MARTLVFTFANDSTRQTEKRCPRKALLLAAVFCVVSTGGSTAQAAYLLVVGHHSNNVVRFDLNTGDWSLWGNFPSLGGHSFPRELAMDDQGQVYASRGENNRNVVKFVSQPGTDVMRAVDFSAQIGQFGPGELQFYQGDLYVAGDRDRSIVRLDGQTGAEISRFSVASSGNIRSLVIDGDDLFYAEIFQSRIRKMDLTQSPPTGGTFLTDLTNLHQTISMAIGASGNLFVASRNNTLVQEFDINTGAFVGTFVDLLTLNPAFSPQNVDIVYNAALNNYFISAGNSVFRLNEQGALLQTYQSDLLIYAYGILVVPEPQSFVLLCFGLVGLAACRFRRRLRS